MVQIPIIDQPNFYYVLKSRPNSEKNKRWWLRMQVINYSNTYSLYRNLSLKGLFVTYSIISRFT